MQPRTDPRLFWSSAAGTCMAYAIWWMQPLLLRYLVADRGYSELAGGLVISGEMCVMAIASTLIARFGTQFGLRSIVLSGLVALAAASAASLVTSSYLLLALSRVVVGAGTGAVLMMANSLAAAFADPDKVFARSNFINLVCGTLLVAIAPWLQASWPQSTPYTTVFSYMALCGLIVLVRLPLLQTSPQPRVSPERPRSAAMTTGDDGTTGRNVWLVLAVIVLVGISGGVIWPFYALIGAKTGMSQSAVDATIAAALLAGLLSTALASLVGGSLGRFWPISLSMVLLAVSVVVLTTSPTPVLYQVATCVNTASLQFMIPYLFGAAASQGTSGRGAVYAGSAFFITGAVSPALGGLVMGGGGRVFGIAMVVAAVLAIGIMYAVERRRA